MSKWELFVFKVIVGREERLNKILADLQWRFIANAILWNARANDVIDSHICLVDNAINQGKLILLFPSTAAAEK